MIDSTDQYLDGNMVGSIDAPAAPKTLESTIAERKPAKVIPSVHPTEQNGEIEKRTLETSSFIKKAKNIELQRNNNEQWCIYRQELLANISIPKSVRRAHCSQEKFYVQMRQLKPKYNPFRFLGSSADACIRMRGLPYIACSLDVYALLSRCGIAYALANERKDIKILITKKEGPSGQAIVKFRTIGDAYKAQSLLQNQYIRGRYVEVYAYVSPFIIVCSTPEPEDDYIPS